MFKKLACLTLTIWILCLTAPRSCPGSLVAHWPFDGNGQDASGNKNDATATGNPIYVPGMSAQAIQFDNVGQYLQIANNPGIQLRSGNGFTVAAYVNAADTDQGNILIHGLGCSTWASWFLGVQGGEPDATLYAERFVFGVRSSNGSAYAGVTGPVVTGEWVHLTATHDGTTLKMWINGQETGSTAAPLPYNSAESLYVGGDPGCNGRSWYTGQVDDVYIFSRSINASQIEGLTSGIMPSWLKAENPDPADGTVGVVAPLLRWTKGDTAMFHNVYLGTSPDLTEADLRAARQPVTLYYHVQGLLPGTTYYWRVDEIEKDGVTTHTGDVWSFVTQDVTAYYPGPTDGSNAVWPAPTLTWMPGMGAIKHQVYFSDSLDAVTQGATEADKGTLELGDTAFAPGVLEPLTTYYWRVDETIGGGTIKAGPVWSFTTVLPVDDFESYTNDEGSRIYETWIDGFTNGNSGSTVGYFEAPFAEQIVVHGGLQSMPLEYNNVDAPWYSEAERTFAAAQDWTAGGVDTLVLYVRGRAGNAAAPLYVALQDAAQKVAAVTHPDLAVATATKWIEWKIPLADFAGVNPARIRTLYLGLGDRQNPQPGATGRVYIDDICLTRPAP